MQINRHTYEQFILLYTDGELSLEEQRAVEDFIRENPDLEEELILLKETVLEPDQSIVFENKEQLYKKEETRKVLPLPWFRIAAAAVVIIFSTLFGWKYFNNREMVETRTVASADQQKDSFERRKPAQPLSVSQEDQPATDTEVSKSVTTKETFTREPRDVDPDDNASKYRTAKQTGNQKLEAEKHLAIQKAPDHSPHEILSVKAPVEKDRLEIKVKPREIEPLVEEAADDAHPVYVVNDDAHVEIQYGGPQDDDIIYIANTSLPKKTKLRGVFRKATRILDKVTSFQ